MRTLLLSAASLVAITTSASAQPSLTAAAPAPVPTPTTYVAGGVTAGAFVGLYAAFTVEAGRRLGTTPLWVHGMLVDGETGGIDEPSTTGRQLQARAGIEARGCVAMQLCAIAGVDAAVAHGDYMAEYDYDNGNRTDVLAIGRVGLDVGGEHLRLRPGIELGSGVRGIEQFALTGALAYQF